MKFHTKIENYKICHLKNNLVYNFPEIFSPMINLEKSLSWSPLDILKAHNLRLQFFNECHNAKLKSSSSKSCCKISSLKTSLRPFTVRISLYFFDAACFQKGLLTNFLSGHLCYFCKYSEKSRKTSRSTITTFNDMHFFTNDLLQTSLSLSITHGTVFGNKW